MSKVNKSKVIVDTKGRFVVLQAELSASEYSVLKLALKEYANGYGLSFLKRLNNAEK